VSTLITHDPADQPPDDDPTGVRDLLSSLPQPAPMPLYLVERINASLAAEQSQRTANTSTTSVTPLLAPTRRRPGRLVFAVAGAAAAVVLFAVVGNNIFQTSRSTTISGSASAPVTSGAREGGGQALQGAADKATRQGSTPPAATPPLVQIRLSGTRYTQAGFVTQVRNLVRATVDQIRPPAAPPAAAAADLGPVGTTPGLLDCLNAIGAGGVQMVRADLAFYEGRPAVIIVATTNGTPMAYAVGRHCSRADAAVLRPATPLP
jgi:hypothetical protein